MAGHSKFKNIMHRKGAQDAKRQKMFTKLQREIFVSAKLGGGDPSANPRLRAAIASARVQNMPNDRIKSAIDKATGAGSNENYEYIRYEGYGPGGVAIIIDALTNNRARTAGEVRMAFDKNDGNLGESNSVSFMFDRAGQILYPLAKAAPDAMFEAAVEAGADDCASVDTHHEIKTSVEGFAATRDALETKYGPAEKAELVWLPNVMAPVDEETAKTVMDLVEMLEDNDDVQTVTTNFEVSDEIMEKLLKAG